MNCLKLTPYQVFCTDRQGNRYETCFDSFEEMMNWCSKVYAFSDIEDDMEITEILNEGMSIHYTGWRRGMHFVFKDEKNKVVWDSCYPEWDH